MLIQKTYFRLLSFVFILLLLSSVFVYAAGSSTGFRVDSNSEVETSDSETENEDSVEVSNEVNCEAQITRQARIKCRLENKGSIERRENSNYDDEENIPEACRSLKNTAACVALYKNTARCFDMNVGERDRCFKLAIGFKNSKVSEETPSEERALRTRHYIVTLLYELQERIELMVENEEISADEASVTIDLIVEIKQNLLDGAKKDEVSPKLRQLKAALKDLRVKANAEAEANE